MSIVGDNLKTLRLLKRMSQTELAKRSGISNTYLNQIEKGIYSNPSLDILSRLAEVLECTVKDLDSYKQESEKRANSTTDMVLSNGPECSISTLILNRLLKEHLIDENFTINDELKKTLEDAIKLDAKLNNNLKKGSE